MSVACPRIFDRKKYIQLKSEEKISKRYNGAALRQLVLSSKSADLLSEEDLRNHVKELRRRRFYSLLGFLVIPVSLYYFKYSTHAIVYSLVPSIFLYSKLYHSRLFNRKSHSFSVSDARKSNQKYLDAIYKINGFKTADSNYKMAKFSPLPIRDWLARNEYR